MKIYDQFFLFRHLGETYVEPRIKFPGISVRPKQLLFA